MTNLCNSICCSINNVYGKVCEPMWDCVWETKPCLMQDNSCWATAVNLKWIKNLFFHYMHFVSALHSPHTFFWLLLFYCTWHIIAFDHIYTLKKSSNFAATWACYRLFCMAESAEWFIFEMDKLGRNGLEDSLWISSSCTMKRGIQTWELRRGRNVSLLWYCTVYNNKKSRN